ncbi:MAG: DUF1641 domain-containing protein [Actinomycetes bacterium]
MDNPMQADSAQPGPGAPDSTGAPDPAGAEVLAKLDAMAVQIAAISEELRQTREAREKWAELMETLVPVSRGAMDVATRELEDLSTDVDFDDAARLARTAIRSMPQLEAMIAQLDSVTELGHEINSISGAGMAKLTAVLQTAEDKGYFVLAREGAAVADRVVDTLVRDGRLVPDQTPSVFSIANTLRDPQTRRGLARLMTILRAVGSDAPTTAAGPEKSPAATTRGRR